MASQTIQPHSLITPKRFSISDSIRYIFREQRLLFVVVGIAIAALISNLLLIPSPLPSQQISHSMHIAESTSVPRRRAYELHSDHLNPGGRIPLGLKPKSMRVLVTGGSGFVGSHLVDRLMARGDNVIVVDNFFTGRKDNVLHHLRNPRFELIRHDVVEPILLEVDQIYHLACPASPVHYKYNPVKTIISFFYFIFSNGYGDHKTNVVGTLNMLGLAKRINARFLLTSTSEVYGDPLEHPQVETYWGNVRIARIFNTYGPRMCLDDGRVVSNFVAQVEGLMRLMEGEHVGPFNLGNPGEFTMLELAKVVQDTIDPNAKIEFRPNTEDDPHKRKPDISRATELLGWQPVVPLREGLPLMVSDFRQRIFGDLKDGDSSTSTFTSVVRKRAEVKRKKAAACICLGFLKRIS
ncbi:NAD-dependent epimerase/dehydratase [Cynara cardunculus var. scolymus]|uniref:UDP-glucuronate decarboxylase n=1 Tax=Cynara cardunculus var. scolymus TaxID=59895 RepID=A0A103XDS7_CYNCS|nr:NAD-dependent epimerase/dehydratase [Cynara cardunculus var. scolymus]